MNFITLPFILLVVSSVLSIVMVIYILHHRPLKQLHKALLAMVSCIMIVSIGVLLQSVLSEFYGVDYIYFEYFIYIGTCFFPVALFFLALIFKNTKIKFQRYYLLLFVIPTLTLLVLWTNNLHHLFFVDYSSDMSQVVFGSYFTIHSLYTYILLFVGMAILLRTSFRTSGIFSVQSILILIGSLIPIIISLLGTAKIIEMNTFWTPISFSATILLYGLAIFKFNFLNVSPIALQRIVNVMSDSYLVLDTDEHVVDYNTTFVETFQLQNMSIRKKKIFDLFHHTKNIENFKKAFYSAIKTGKTFRIDFFDSAIGKYFNIELSPLYNKKVFIGSLILFKDVTQHMTDMKRLKDSQETLMEAERLASLGQLIGGIAHNLKTPIMSIAGATEGISDLIKEYDSSIDDSQVNSQDHHEIAHDMMVWTEKIKEYSEYMSDVISAVKGQAVVMSETDNINFDVEELVKRINILMRHELKNAIVYLNVSLQVPANTSLHGDINSLIQVINNMISNSIFAYNGKPNQTIDLIIHKDDDNHLIISIKDYGPGLPAKVQDKLFTEMITTKGKNGTGLGLYMSYSTIKAHFGGDITFETKKDKGTTFNILLPMSN